MKTPPVSSTRICAAAFSFSSESRNTRRRALMRGLASESSGKSSRAGWPERAAQNEVMGELLQRHREPIVQALAQADGSGNSITGSMGSIRFEPLQAPLSREMQQSSPMATGARSRP